MMQHAAKPYVMHRATSFFFAESVAATEVVVLSQKNPVGFDMLFGSVP